MLNISDLTTGTYVVYKNDPHQVVWREHSKVGRGGAILRVKLKNLITGNVSDTTLKGSDKLEEADISRSQAQFTYREDDKYHFMDSTTFEQFGLNQDIIGEAAMFLKEGTEVDVIKFENKPINVNVPVKIDLKVSQTQPAVRGNTAQGSVTKPATLESGATIQVPIFVETGDVIKVNTEKSEYVERV